MSCAKPCAQMATEDKQWKERLAAGVSYPAGDDVLEVAQQAYIDFFSVNALYPTIFPSTDRFEREVIEMTAGLLHGDEAVGAISSGGTESNLLGVKSARDRARALRPEVTAPQIVAPASAHPSFQKAADYFGLELVSTPLTPDGLVDVSGLPRRRHRQHRPDGRLGPQHRSRHGGSDPRDGGPGGAARPSASTSTPASAATSCHSPRSWGTRSYPGTSACPV